ncbi:S49 family peptidase [Hydrogenophaga sp.]|uniref:S49 family peptidase n=1 Tax=Hydrogenophaga sp. TaxID=1904254 RepID=UPI003BB21F50
MAALDASHVRALLTEYAEARARYTGPMEAPTARAGAMAGAGMVTPYTLGPGGVAVIALGGTMMQRPGFLARLFLDAVDTVEIAAAIEEAGRDPSVRSVLLKINSPGGAVHGTAELAAAVAGVAVNKPVVALNEGCACSAAYWVAASCSQVYGSSPNVMAGSIGVVSVHTYNPSASGAVVTEIKSGKFKTVGSDVKPLSGDDLAHMQGMVDYLATQFINAVATSRRLTAASVAAQEARVYIGQQAVDAGLLDGFMSAGELERQLAADPGRFMRHRPGATTNAPAPVKTTSASSATTWPPKPQPVVSGPVTPATMLEQTGQAEEDMRAEAAEIVRMHKLTTARWPKVMTWKGWEAAGAARARQDGCTLVEGIKREGYLHPYVSTPDSPKRGAPGAKPAIELNRNQLAERGAAWAQFKGINVVEAFKYLGFKG